MERFLLKYYLCQTKLNSYGTLCLRTCLLRLRIFRKSMKDPNSTDEEHRIGLIDRVARLKNVERG